MLPPLPGANVINIPKVLFSWGTPKLYCHLNLGSLMNSFSPSDAIWQQGSRSTLVQIMASCLMASSHYLNQCWLIITKVQWCSPEGNLARDITAISHKKYLENYFSKILLESPRGQWVKLTILNLYMYFSHKPYLFLQHCLSRQVWWDPVVGSSCWGLPV